ncbi:multiple epidermal growth factor-like domains protein 10 [Saccostrea cucullata]|uniref:multiple epidermal growth factor-like domains protein 10 n=1 Tax=Saccostrea cuccullata TaxID=36930 RepID=UPI002ED1EDF7
MKVTTLFISIYITLFCPLCALEGKHICSYTRSGKKYFDCCLGYKEMNGVCVQKVCYPGYVGKYCNTTCPENYFGQGCSFKCKCEQTQYCHHACGCLLRSVKSGNMSKDGKNSTKISRDDIVPDNCMGELKTATNITRGKLHHV